MQMRRLAAAMAAFLAGVGGAGTASAADWVTHQGSAGHTGAAPELHPPFARHWQAPIEGAAIYGSPVVAGGRVYVASQDRQARGTIVAAFESRTGKRLWQTLAAGLGGRLAYGDGRLYVLGDVLSALDAKSGAPLWSREAEDGIPTPGAGVVVIPVGVGFDTGVAVVDGRTGGILWSSYYHDTGATPATDGHLVYATWACGRVRALDITTGALAWEAPCREPGAGTIEAELDGRRLHVRGVLVDDVLDAGTGRVLGRLSSMAYAAYGNGAVYSVTGERPTSLSDNERYYPYAGLRLEAHAGDDLHELWRFSDGGVAYDPVAVGGAVVLPTEHALYALDARTGSVVWRDAFVANRGGLAAGDGLLFATAGQQLVAYGSADPVVRARRLAHGRLLITVTGARPGALVRAAGTRTRVGADGRARLKVRARRVRVTVDAHAVRVRS